MKIYLSRRTVLSSIAAAAAFAASPLAVRAGQKEIFTGESSGAAINGYDAVAYFTENKPVKGSETIKYEWKGAVWRFSSEANKAAFAAAPGKYAPQYGGYCAYAVSKGSTAKTEPDAFSVVDGKLYLNFSQDVRAIWRKDVPGNIANADRNWPSVLN